MKRLREKNKGEFTGQLDMPGDLDMAAGVTVTVKGYGIFDGKYIVETATHSISKSSGFKTSIKIRRVLEGY